MPCRSGSPHAVLGVDHEDPAPPAFEAAWPAARPGANRSAAPTAAAPAIYDLSRMSLLLKQLVRRGPASPGRLLRVFAVHQFLGELDALELEHLRVLLETAVHRHADLPGLREDALVLDRRLVHHRIRRQERVPLDDVQAIARV